MRKYVKNNLLNIVNVIERANSLVLSFSEANNTEKLVDILTQEQEAAIQVGTELENNNQTSLVSLLEDYCECLYRISQDKDKSSRKKQIKELSTKMATIKTQIAALKEEYDIVFMPYKASMWDALESIWLAAKEDPDCHCYVIPIPYNDMNEDKTRGTLHYEDDLFPDYVPITSYEDYDIAVKHPEVIYIHNPYDQYNHVTNVAEPFFASNLKQYTDMLVYVPYFFSSGKFPADHSLLAAYFYADKIIVQSKECIETIDEKIPREKIVALGSPKVDRILRLAKDKQHLVDEVIPAEWKKKIEGKKVILYNSALNSILADFRLVINKMRYVFSQFEKRNDVVLLWRPHPLMEGTLKALRNTNYDEYMELKNSFCNSAYGILDETPDPAISSVIADAYIGEKYSSMINYFAVQGKLCYFLDWDKLEETYTKEERSAFRVGEVVMKNNYLYYVPRKEGLEHVLFRTNMDTGEVERVLKMPGKPNYTFEDDFGRVYLDMLFYKDNIILPPYNTDDVYIYNCKDGSALCYILPETDGCCEKRFCGNVEYKQKIFFLPINYPGILECDFEKLEFKMHNDWVNAFDNGDMPAFFEGGCFVKKDNLLYMATLNEAKILIFNMDDKTHRIVTINDFNSGFCSMVYDGKDFWLSGWKQDVIVRWNENAEVCDVYSYKTEKKENENVGGVYLVNSKEKLTAFHTSEQYVFDIDKKTGKIKKHAFVQSTSDYVGKLLYTGRTGYAFVKQLDDEWIKVLDQDGFNIILWNRVTDEQRIYPCRISERMLYDYEKEEIEEKRIIKNEYYQIYESTLDINVFLDYVSDGNVFFSESVECYKKGFAFFGNSGQMIHEYIKKN